MKHVRKRLTYANVMSSIAVFLLLGGATALAAGLAKNSVGSKQLKKNAVTTAKIKNEAVTAAKIKKGTITGAQINLGSLGTVPSAANAGNANAVGGFPPSSLIRSAYGSTNTAVTVGGSGTGTTVISATITAPTNGFLLVNSNATWEASTTGALVHAGLDVDDAGIGTWSSDDTRSVSIQMGSNTIESGGPSARFAVPAGVHTVRLKAHNDGSGTLSLRGGSLTVLFEPFDANG